MMSTDRSRSLLILENVRKVFSRGTVDEVTALDGVNLNVFDRDFVTVIGSNGAGKSTALNVISGVYPPGTGSRVIINDKDVTAIPEHDRAAWVSRVYQEPEAGTSPNLTIEENLALALLRGQPRRLRGAVNKKRREVFREALEPLGLGLENRLTAPVGTLSGGQRQALALVMATISRPSLLLLDEHIATLDPRAAETILKLTDMIIQREQTTALMVTHNMEIALRYGNRLVMMHRGKTIVDIEAERKNKLTVNDLVNAFERAAGEQLADESIMLGQH
ncbi:MAG: ABC transporter ATP-binding protein [Chloroflexota bacterium]